MKIIKSIHKYLFLLVLLLVILPGTKVKAEVTYDNCNEKNIHDITQELINNGIIYERTSYLGSGFIKSGTALDSDTSTLCGVPCAKISADTVRELVMRRDGVVWLGVAPHDYGWEGVSTGFWYEAQVHCSPSEIGIYYAIEKGSADHQWAASARAAQRIWGFYDNGKFYVTSIVEQTRAWGFGQNKTKTEGEGNQYWGGEGWDGGRLLGGWSSSCPGHYEMKYEGNGGSWSGQGYYSERATGQTSYTAKGNMFSRTGYTFNGWSGGRSGTFTVDSEQTWTATWKPIQYTMTMNHYKYNPNTGKWDFWKSTTAKADYDSTFTPPYESAPYGYHTHSRDHNDGWKVTGDASFAVYYYPNEHTLTYNREANGGNSGTNSTVKVLYGKYLDFSPSAKKTGDTGVYSSGNPDGWQFIGWSTNVNATSSASSGSMPDKDLTLYALYKKTITAKFRQYSGSEYSPTVTDTSYSKTVYNKTTSVTFAENTIKIPDYWTNVGWTTGTDATAAVTTDLTIAQDTQFYRRYDRYIKVKFIDQAKTVVRDGTRHRNSADINNITAVTRQAPVALDKVGWQIIGWTTSTSQTANIELNERQSFNLTTDKVYYARYNKCINVLWNWTDDEWRPQQSSQQQTAYYNTSGNVTYPTFKMLAKQWNNGLIFRNWNTNEAGTGIAYSAEQSYVFKDSAVLFATFDSVPIADLQLSDSAVSILSGDTYQIDATVLPAATTSDDIAYTSDDTDVATVNTTGLVTGVKNGTAVISVKSKSNPSVSATCSVTVSSGAVSIPKTIVLGSVGKLGVRTNSSTGATARLYLTGLTQLKGVDSGKSYQLAFKLKGDDKYTEKKPGDLLLETKGSAAQTFMITTNASLQSLQPDQYKATATYKLELKK